MENILIDAVNCKFFYRHNLILKKIFWVERTDSEKFHSGKFKLAYTNQFVAFQINTDFEIYFYVFKKQLLYFHILILAYTYICTVFHMICLNWLRHAQKLHLILD